MAIEAQSDGATRRSLLALYFLGAVTGGLYLLYWLFETLKRDAAESNISVHPAAAAVGSAAAPVQAAFLFDIYRRSHARRGLSTGAWSCAAPAALALALPAVVALLPSRSLLTPGWLLAPLPFLLVQRSLNRETDIVPAIRSTKGNVARTLIGVLGATVTLAVAYGFDLPAARILLHPSLQSGESVLGESALYTVRLSNRGWRRLSPGTIGDEGSDLELVAPDELSWLVAYVTSAREVSLQNTVATRRSLIRQLGKLEEFREERRFAPGNELIPVSTARYRVGSSLTSQAFEVYTASVDDRIVEIVAFTSGSEDARATIRSLIASVELAPPKGVH